MGPGPAPSPCKTLSPTGLPSNITAFITPDTLAIYVLFLTKHGCTLSNNLLSIISVIPSNFILKLSCSAISKSLLSIFSIPSIRDLLDDIVLLKESADKILTFAIAS